LSSFGRGGSSDGSEALRRKYQHHLLPAVDERASTQGSIQETPLPPVPSDHLYEELSVVRQAAADAASSKRSSAGSNVSRSNLASNSASTTSRSDKSSAPRRHASGDPISTINTVSTSSSSGRSRPRSFQTSTPAKPPSTTRTTQNSDDEEDFLRPTSPIPRSGSSSQHYAVSSFGTAADRSMSEEGDYLPPRMTLASRNRKSSADTLDVNDYLKPTFGTFEVLDEPPQSPPPPIPTVSYTPVRK